MNQRRKLANDIKNALAALEEDILDEDFSESELATADDGLLDDEDANAVFSDDSDDLLASDEDSEIPELEEELDMTSVTASVESPGIEDEIKDTANGGIPVVQETVLDKGNDAIKLLETDAEVFPTNSEFISDSVVASSLKMLGKLASGFEKKGSVKLAWHIDRCADVIEFLAKKSK